MKYLIIPLLLIASCTLYAQNNEDLTITFQPLYGTSAVHLNQSLNEEQLNIETLKFYISNIQLFDSLSQEITFTEKNSYHLIDASDKQKLSVKIPIPDSINYTNIHFNIGIDSITNMSGVFGDDLDPTNGMYWTWQSGYINFKLEGKANNCPSRKNEFQFHLGGFASPFNCLRKVNLVLKNKETILIDIALDQLFNNINFEEINHIMSPNKKAMDFSNSLPSILSIRNED